MDILRNWEALQRLTATVPRSAPGYSTNLYGDRAQIDRWGAAGRLRVHVADGAVLMLRDDRDFRRVYHVSRDAGSLTAALSALPADSFTADLIGRGQHVDAACEAYVAGGFGHHAFLQRMTCGRPIVVAEGDGDVVTADPGDAEEVAAFLGRLLDPLTDQLPDLDDLRDAARAGLLLLVRHSAGVAGMLMYDVKGQLAHLRFWHVDPDLHGGGVGRQLMKTFLSRCAEARRIVLWVMGNNDRSIAIYRHYGFAADGLIDHIMTRDKDRR